MNRRSFTSFFGLVLLGSPVGLLAQTAKSPAEAAKPTAPTKPAAGKEAAGKSATTTTSMETATLASGCFWCTEAVYQRIKGVTKVVSGYANGKVKNPSYEQVCSGETGHAECVQVTFDPRIISYDKILEIFWQQHDPTTLNQQGHDRGTQYRSGIYYAGDAQKKTAEESKQKHQAQFNNGIVTEVTPLVEFYSAESYHQNYFTLNKDKNPYCRVVIWPKLKKLGIETKDPETTKESATAK
jgi:peptide-methionine (S)-S-oxide reductase